MAKVKIALDLNGEPAEVAFAPHKTLLEVLREDLGLTGTKHGCELGECGTCTVLLDDRPVLSCLVLGQACAGRRVQTVEGMAARGQLHPLQDTFAELSAGRSRRRSRATCAAAPATSRSTRPSNWPRLACEVRRQSRHRRRSMAAGKRKATERRKDGK